MTTCCANPRPSGESRSCRSCGQTPCLNCSTPVENPPDFCPRCHELYSMPEDPAWEAYQAELFERLAAETRASNQAAKLRRLGYRR